MAEIQIAIDTTSFLAAAVPIVVAELVLVGLGWFRFIKQMKTKAPLSAPAGWGTTADDRKWEVEAAALAHTELAEVREAAKTWAASIGAVLGIAGTVAFVKGEDKFASLTTQEGNYAFWLTVSAALLAGFGIALAAFAAQGTPARYKGIDGWTLRNVSRSRSLTAMRRLLWSKVLVVVAGLAILASAGISWKASIAEEETEASDPVLAIVTTVDGLRRCGELSTAPRGNVWVGRGKDRVQVDGTNEIVIVESCPGPE